MVLNTSLTTHFQKVYYNMSNARIKTLKIKIRELTRELNGCIEELLALVDEDVPVTGATEYDMGIQKQLSLLVKRKG